MICNPYQTRRFPWSKRPNLSHISELLRICLTRHLHLKIPAQGRALECAGEHQPFNTGRDPAPTGCSCKEPRVLYLTHTSHRLLVQRAAGVVPYLQSVHTNRIEHSQNQGGYKRIKTVHTPSTCSKPHLGGGEICPGRRSAGGVALRRMRKKRGAMRVGIRAT